MATVPMTGERFDIGRVAALTFGVIGRNPLLFIGVALLFSGLPAFVLALPDVEAARSGFGEGIGFIVPVVIFVFSYFVLGSLMQTSLVVATLQDLSGQRVDFAACLKRALVMFLPLVGLSILISLGVGAATILLVVPGIIVYVMWFVAVPALVEERRGVFAALGRSRALTKGARWPIFGLVVAYLILSLVVGLASGLTSVFSLTPTAAAVVSAVVTMLTSLIASAGVAATYVELRTVKEGANVDALAAVFA